MNSRMSTPARDRLYVNGRFLTQPRTGVQRYAQELLRQWDQMLTEGEIDGTRNEIIVLTPRGQGNPRLFARIKTREVGRLGGNLWEQIELPVFASAGRLFNPCNSGPWLWGDRQAITIHDASVFAVPQAYSRAFRLKHQLLYRHFGATARQIVTVSQSSRAELLRWCHIPESKVRVIYSGCEHILAQPGDPAILERHHLTGRPFVLAVGSNSAHKNLAAVLQLPNLLGGREMDFVIAGGTYRNVFQHVRYENSEKVHWLGFVSDAELRALYERAAVFVYPSRYEGFGFPALEAMACGCPAVLSSATSLPEVGGEAVLYCDPADATTLASGVRAIISSRDLSLRLVAAGRERAKLFTWPNCARNTWEILKRDSTA
jgi:glycosyltransferase involved in cell wall biosynthesis